MTMNPEQQHRFETMEEDIQKIKDNMLIMKEQMKSMYNVITGDDPLNKQPSFASRLYQVEQSQKFYRVLLIGVAVGIIVGGLIFGVLTLKTVVDAIKTIKP